MQLSSGVLVAPFLFLVFHPFLGMVAGSLMKRRFCLPCVGDECDRRPEDECPFGLVKNHCGSWECGKGPGESCGGPSKMFGQCGDGMHCKCDQCVGCSSKTYDCELSTNVC